MTVASSDKQTILIIDDSEIVLEVTKGALESAGYRVITRSRAAGSVALLLQENPDLVLLDVNMPTTSGDTLAMMFDKARPGGETIILLHSTLAPEVLQAKANAVAAHGYIQKSGDLFNLVRIVNRWLKRQRTTPSGNFESAGGSHSSGSLRAARRVVPESSPFPESGTSVRASNLSAGAVIPRVLFVANDISVLSDYRRVVQGLDLISEFALSGMQALRKVQSEEAPDVMVCNASLSDIAGADLYQRIIEHDPSWRRRVILVTRAGDAAPPDVTAIREPLSAQAVWDSVRGAVPFAPRLRSTGTTR